MIHDLVIVGGGISGLSLAHDCAKAGLRPLVLEGSDRTGGCVHTVTPDGATWVELGAHTCYNSYGNLISIADELSLLPLLGKKKRLPFRLWSPTGLRSIASQLNWLEAAGSISRAFRLRRKGRSVRSFFEELVGRNNYQRVVGPAMNAVICQQAAEFPADLIFKKRPRRKDVPRGFTFHGGLQRLTDALARSPGVTVRTGTPVRAARFESDAFVLRTVAGEEIQARRLALATPAAAASGILEALAPEVSKHLATIQTVPLESAGTVVSSSSVSIPPIAGMIFPSLNPDIPLFSVVSRDVVPDPRNRGFTFHFKPNALDGEGKRAFMREVLGIFAPGPVVTSEHHLPALRPKHDQWVTDLHRLLDRQGTGNRLLVVGNYFQGLALEDCVSRAKAEAERTIGNPGR